MKTLKTTLLPLAVVGLSASNLTPAELPQNVTTIGNAIDTIHRLSKEYGVSRMTISRIVRGNKIG